MVTVRVLAGWNVGRLYPKARSPLVVRLGPGETVKRTVTLRLASASELAKSLARAEAARLRVDEDVHDRLGQVPQRGLIPRLSQCAR